VEGRRISAALRESLSEKMEKGGDIGRGIYLVVCVGMESGY